MRLLHQSDLNYDHGGLVALSERLHLKIKEVHCSLVVAKCSIHMIFNNYSNFYIETQVVVLYCTAGLLVFGCNYLWQMSQTLQFNVFNFLINLNFVLF